MEGLRVDHETDCLYYLGEFCGRVQLNGIFEYYPITPKKVISFMLGIGFIGKPAYFETT